MALRTVSSGEFEEIVDSATVNDVILEVVDGDAGYLTTDRQTATKAGQRVEPGQSLIIEPVKGLREQLHALGQDLTFQLTQQNRQSSTENVRNIQLQSQSKTVARSLARATNQTPGAGADLFNSDISPPETGSLQFKIQTASATTVSVDEDITGGPELSMDLNGGKSLTAGAAHSFTLPCRGDATYNIQEDSGVEFDICQVDYSREVQV